MIMLFVRLGAAMVGALRGAPATWLTRPVDGWVLCAAIVATTRAEDVGEAIADCVNLGAGEGLMGLLQGLGRALMPCLLTWVAAEWVARRTPGGILLGPLLTAGLLFRASLELGAVNPSALVVFEVAGALVSVLMAWSVRAPQEQAAGEEVADEEVAESEPSSRHPRRRVMIGMGTVGVVGAAGAAWVGVHDAREVARRWSSMGTLGVGADVPAFRARTLGGAVFDDAGVRGRPTMLVFWATWCGYCVRQMPSIQSIHEELGGAGLRVVGVNVERARDRETKVRSYVEEHGLAFEQVLDHGTIADGFRVTLLPHVVVLDADGTVAAVFRGKTREGRLKDAANAVLEPPR